MLSIIANVYESYYTISRDGKLPLSNGKIQCYRIPFHVYCQIQDGDEIIRIISNELFPSDHNHDNDYYELSKHFSKSIITLTELFADCKDHYKTSLFEYKFRNGLLHCNNGPALTIFDIKTDDAKPMLQVYCIDGRLHRRNGPAITENIKMIKVVMSNNEEQLIPFKQWLPGEKMPRRILGVFNFESTIWLQNSGLHRKDGPAINIDSENITMYMRNNTLHREDGPAFMCKGTNISFNNGELITVDFLPNDFWEKDINKALNYAKYVTTAVANECNNCMSNHVKKLVFS